MLKIPSFSVLLFFFHLALQKVIATEILSIDAKASRQTQIYMTVRRLKATIYVRLLGQSYLKEAAFAEIIAFPEDWRNHREDVEKRPSVLIAV